MGCFGLLLLLSIAGISAWVRHARDRSFWRASALAAVQSAILWTALVVLMRGHRATGIGTAAAFAAFWSFALACAVGLGFRFARRSRMDPEG